MAEGTNNTTQSMKYAAREAELITPEQLEILEGIIERLEKWEILTVTKITPVWYIVEGFGNKIQLEVDNPGANLDIVEIEAGDEELRFPRKSWGAELTKLTFGNEGFSERKIIAKFAISR